MFGPHAPALETKDGTCPECGEKLGDAHARYKHSVKHWGDEPLPNIPQNYVARSRQAFVLNRERPKE